LKELKAISLQELRLRFNSDEACLEFLAGIKWSNGFVCRKCGNTNYCAGKKPYSRRCTKCKAEESATSHTLFHNCRIALPEAFRMIKIIMDNPHVSTYALSEDTGIRQMTCWRMKKLAEEIGKGSSKQEKKRIEKR
jgi:hypothetical protein